MKILVTGAAGFIGAALCKSLLARGDKVIGIDSLNDYYDVQLKEDRLASIDKTENFQFLKLVKFFSVWNPKERNHNK